MSNRRKANPSVEVLAPYLRKVGEWSNALRRGVPVDAVRRDMDRGQLAHDHLTDEELEDAVERMRVLRARLPRDPGAASAALLKAMRL
jgi:hypothetical protein